MNLLERNNASEDKDWRDDLRDRCEEDPEQDIIDLEQDADKEESGKTEKGGSVNGGVSFLQKPYMTVVLLGIIVVLWIILIS